MFCEPVQCDVGVGGAVGICGGEVGGKELSSSSSVSKRALLM